MTKNRNEKIALIDSSQREFKKNYKLTRREIGSSYKLRLIYMRNIISRLKNLALASVPATIAVGSAMNTHGYTVNFASPISFMSAVGYVTVCGTVCMASALISDEIRQFDNSAENSQYRLDSYRREMGKPSTYGKTKSLVNRRRVAICELRERNGRESLDLK